MDSSQWGAAASSGAAGAKMGSSFGTWGTVIGAVGGAALGIFSSGGESQNAANIQNTASWNAAAGNYYGAINARNTMAAANASAAMSRGFANVRATAIENTAIYNANIVSLTTEYNSLSYDKEIDLLWDSYELDSEQRKYVQAKSEGTYNAMGGASGVEIGNDGDSNTLGLIDMQTQYALDQFVIKRNAHIQAGKLNDAKAMGEWEGAVEVQKILYEGRVNATLTRMDGQMQGMSSILQGQLTSSSIMNNAKMGGIMGEYNAGVDATRVKDAGTQQMWDGFLSGAGTVASMYGSSSSTSSGGSSTVSGTSNLYKRYNSGSGNSNYSVASTEYNSLIGGV